MSIEPIDLEEAYGSEAATADPPKRPRRRESILDLYNRVTGLSVKVTQLDERSELTYASQEILRDKLKALEKTEAVAPTRPPSPGEYLATLRWRRSCDIKIKTYNERDLIGKSWRPTNQPCTCGREHKAIIVNDKVMCPIKYYLTLGRLALFNLTETPSQRLFDALMRATRSK